MINLLPPEVKEDYRYGLRNTGLLRWVSILAITIVGLLIIATYGLLTIQNSTNTYKKQVAAAQTSLQKQDLSGTETQVKDITTNLKLVYQVLSKEVLFSKLLNQIATVIPKQTVLKSLVINQTTGGIDLIAAASNYQTATQVQVNLADPANHVFSKADIVSISCPQNPEIPAYPCTIQLRALFSSSSGYLFINNKAS